MIWQYAFYSLCSKGKWISHALEGWGNSRCPNLLLESHWCLYHDWPKLFLETYWFLWQTRGTTKSWILGLFETPTLSRFCVIGMYWRLQWNFEFIKETRLPSKTSSTYGGFSEHTITLWFSWYWVLRKYYYMVQWSTWGSFCSSWEAFAHHSSNGTKDEI